MSVVSSIVNDISDRQRYKFNKHPFVSMFDDPLGAFSQVPSNVLHVEDIRSYIYCKMETIGDEEIHKDLGIMCNNELSLKFEYLHLKGLNLVKYMFYTKFDNHDWTRII